MTAETSFGRWLQRRRKALDLTQEALAQRVVCAAETLRKIEADVRRPSRQMAERLAEALEIPEADRAAFIKAARSELAVDRLNSPTQDIPQATIFSAKSISLSSKPITNLPAPLTTFIGREKEQSDVIRLITKHRLVTLTGSGGVGKTRLSLRVGEQVLGNYADGVWLVEFAPIFDALLVPRTTAMAIGLRDEPQRPVIDMLSDYLREKQLLIVLDNCEHLLDACAQLADTLLRRCPSLKILATSREVLSMLGEAVYHVPSLELPDIEQLLEKFRDYESVRLFEERAQLARTDFLLTIENAPSVARICSRLDGIPLAIELAAARVSTLSPEQIEERLQKTFSLLTTGNRTALPRHQTLQAAIDWSYDLLSPVEQTLFRRLAVFVNGWTLEAAESICSDANIKSEAILDLLAQLINKSLVTAQEEDQRNRYRMLETIRQYANEKLVEVQESDMLRDRHLKYFLNLAVTAEPHLIRPEQIEWLPLLDADYENLRSAFEWSLSKDTAEPSLNMCKALGWFWNIRDSWFEGSNWSTRALAKPTQDASHSEKVARARALYTRAMLERHLGTNLEQILSLVQASLALALEGRDKRDIAIAKCFLAVTLLQSGEDDDRGFSLIEETFKELQALKEPFWQTYAFYLLGSFLLRRTELRFQDWVMQSLELARHAGERLILADALWSYADWLFRVNRVEEAINYSEESEKLYKEIGSERASLNPFLFAEIAWINGDIQSARSIYMGLEQRFRLLGEKGFRSLSIGKLGLLAMEEGNLDQANEYLEKALMLEREAGWKSFVAFYLIELGNLSYLKGKLEECKENFRESLSLKNYFGENDKTYSLMTMLGSLCFLVPESSAKLLGVINNHQGDFDYPRSPVEKRYCRRAETHARESLGNSAFESALAEGQELSLDEALEFALKTVEKI